MRGSHCKGKIKFIIYGYYYLPFGWRMTTFLLFFSSPKNWRGACRPRGYQIQIMLENQFCWAPSDQIKPQDIIRLGLYFSTRNSLESYETNLTFAARD
jgi:hypothetical protein